MKALAPGQRKAAALALLIAAVAAVAALVAAPAWLLHRHYDDALEDARDRLARYQRVIGTRPELQQRIERVRKEHNADGFYLKSSQAALAAAEIQDVAKNIIESSGGKLISMQVMPHKDEGEYRQVPVSVQFNGNIKVVRKVLFKLEGSRPYVFPDNLTIRSMNAFAARNQPNVDPELAVQVELSGYARKGGA